MAVFNKFNCFVVDMGLGKHNFPTAALKYLLTNTLPVAADAVTTDITQITAGNGYTAGGNALTYTSWDDDDVAGVGELVIADAQVLASGGAIAQFQYVVLVNSTPAGGALMGWYDYGAAVDMADGEKLDIDFDDGTGSGTLTVGP